MRTPASSPSDLTKLRWLVKVILRAKPSQIKKHALDLFALRELQGPTARRLLLRLLDHADPAVQEPAAYQLGWLHDIEAADPLLHMLEDRQRHPRVRAQVAEAIGLILGHGDRRTIAMRTSTAVMIAVLEDEDPLVRFWACYALGSMRARSALSALRQVARHDRSTCPGWWKVSDEAADAITVIAGGRPPERERIGVELPLAARSS